jgi:hypothetical protein
MHLEKYPVVVIESRTRLQIRVTFAAAALHRGAGSDEVLI